MNSIPAEKVDIIHPTYYSRLYNILASTMSRFSFTALACALGVVNAYNNGQGLHPALVQFS